MSNLVSSFGKFIVISCAIGAVGYGLQQAGGTLGGVQYMKDVGGLTEVTGRAMKTCGFFAPSLLLNSANWLTKNGNVFKLPSYLGPAFPSVSGTVNETGRGLGHMLGIVKSIHSLAHYTLIKPMHDASAYFLPQEKAIVRAEA